MAQLLVDLTHTIHEGIPTWHGSCGFQSKILIDYTDSLDATQFRVQEICMQAGIGTHMDAPAHCIPQGSTVADIPLHNLLAPAVVIDVSNCATAHYLITKEDIIHHEEKQGAIKQGSFVICATGWSALWNNPEAYRNNLVFPTVSYEAAQYLLEREIVGLGIDTLSPDSPTSGFPVHQLLLSAGTYIIENIADPLQLPPQGAYILALPLKTPTTEAPVRLIGGIFQV